MWHAVGMKKGRDLDVEGILTADLGFERFWKREMGKLLGLPKGRFQSRYGMCPGTSSKRRGCLEFGGSPRWRRWVLRLAEKVRENTGGWMWQVVVWLSASTRMLRTGKLVGAWEAFGSFCGLAWTAALAEVERGLTLPHLLLAPSRTHYLPMADPRPGRWTGRRCRDPLFGVKTVTGIGR